MIAIITIATFHVICNAVCHRVFHHSYASKWDAKIVIAAEKCKIPSKGPLWPSSTLLALDCCGTVKNRGICLSDYRTGLCCAQISVVGFLIRKASSEGNCAHINLGSKSSEVGMELFFKWHKYNMEPMNQTPHHIGLMDKEKEKGSLYNGRTFNFCVNVSHVKIAYRWS